MSLELKEHLQNNPQIKEVFLNTKGEWQFHKRDGYEKKLTRNEVLDQQYEPKPEVDPDEPEKILAKTKPGKYQPAKTKK